MIPPPGAGGVRGMTAYVYLLRSQADGSFYVGWTTDVRRRLVEHAAGHTMYTRRKGPWRFVGFESFPSHEAAKTRERSLKQPPRMLMVFKKRLLNQAAIDGSLRQVVG